MANALTQYKLLVLYMLDRAQTALSNTDISGFILEKEYTDYFTLQQTLSELAALELVHTESTHNNTLYRISRGGRETLGFFSGKISQGMKEDVLSYFDAHHIRKKKELSIVADFRRKNTLEYEVRCQIREKESSILDLSLSVNTREQAEAVCRNWQASHEDVYEYLMETLIQ